MGRSGTAGKANSQSEWRQRVLASRSGSASHEHIEEKQHVDGSSSDDHDEQQGAPHSHNVSHHSVSRHTVSRSIAERPGSQRLRLNSPPKRTRSPHAKPGTAPGWGNRPASMPASRSGLVSRTASVGSQHFPKYNILICLSLQNQQIGFKFGFRFDSKCSLDLCNLF